MTHKEFERAMEWWLKQGDNADYEVVRTAIADFPNGFGEIFWSYGGETHRDRIRKRGKEYILEVIN